MGEEATAVVRLPFEQAVTALRANKSRAIFFIGLWVEGLFPPQDKATDRCRAGDLRAIDGLRPAQ